MEYYSILVPMVNFDILSSFDWYEDFLKSISSKNKRARKALKRALEESGFTFKPENPDDPRIPNQIQRIGYDSHNVLLNLGTVTMVFMFYFAKIIVLFAILKPINLMFNVGKKLYKKWYREMFWSKYLVLFFEMYLEILLIGVISMYVPE